VSRLRDTAAELVAKVRTQALAASLPGGQTDEERRSSWAPVDRLLERLMERIHDVEPVIDALEDFRDLPRGAGPKATGEVVSRLLKALCPPGTPAPAPPAIPGFARAGDVQLPGLDEAPTP
jgi:hypothetical protein